MTTQTLTLTEFLLARIAEDEANFTAAVDAEVESLRSDGMPDVTAQEIRDYWLRPESRLWWKRVLAECEAKRALIADLTAEKHEVVEDCWYTCAAATEDRDGGTCCDDGRGDECDCGRDFRVSRRLAILALSYAEHPDFDESWRA